MTSPKDLERRLEVWTKTYWDQPEVDVWDYYLNPNNRKSDWSPQPLLYLEMERAKQHGRLPELDEQRPITLVLLVGESFDPLLQSVWAYCPTRLVPVLNQRYAGRDGDQWRDGDQQWGHLVSLIKQLPPEKRQFNQSLPDPTDIELVEDDPLVVFNYLYKELRQELQKPKSRIVVDITGAKKTIVAGAFLFAAYTNSEIAYVDFAIDRYDPKRRRPYGFTCNFRLIRNPFEQLALRDWERAAQLYKQYDFVGALNVLPDTLPVNLQEWQSNLDKLRSFLSILSLWEDGNFREAKKRVGTLSLALQKYVPSAVTALGDLWPDPNQERATWLSIKFLGSPQAVILYTQDELARAKRLLAAESETRRDRRAAFVRAYSLHETLIKARAVGAFLSGAFEVERNDTKEIFVSNALLQAINKNSIADWFLKLQAGPTEKKLLEQALARNNNPYGGKWLSNLGASLEVKMWRRSNASIPRQALQLSSSTLIESVREKRNAIVHTFVPVSEEDARAAITLAEENLTDYRKNWASNIEAGFDPDWAPDWIDLPDWRDLKTLCGISFIPDKRPDLQEETR